MAVKIIDNISIVQAIPNVNTEIVRDVSKPLSFYLVGTGSGQWSATVTLYEIDPIGYKKIGNDTSFTVTNSNPMELFTWSSNAKSFVIRVSSIKNASVTVYMTQAESSQLERILLTEPSQGTKAMPSDIVGCAAEYVAGQGWIGNLGVLDSKAVLDSFPTNALVPGKVWAIVASASSFAKYNYMSAGWVLESSVGATGASNLPGSPSAPFATEAELLAVMSSAPLRTVVWFANPNVPWLASRLWRIGTAGTIADWVPPPMEVVLRKLRGSAAVATVTPGVLTLQTLFASDVIPDVFLPKNALMQINADAKAINAAGIAGALLGVGVMGAEPTSINTWDYPYALTVTPTGTFSNPPGITIGVPRILKITADGTQFKHPASSASLELNLGGSFVAGNNRMYVMCKASKADDIFSLDSLELIFGSI